jgi:hypothetical protein
MRNSSFQTMTVSREEWERLTRYKPYDDSLYRSYQKILSNPALGAAFDEEREIPKSLV